MFNQTVISFISFISFMTENRSISPRELAQAIGVSESSVKRWVDSGRLQVTRTAGGHRRISLPEAIGFIRESGHPLLNPEALGIAFLPASEQATGDSLPEDPLVEALKAGEADSSRRIMLARFVAGESVASLCDGPVAQVLQKVGDMWQHRSDGILIEHRTTFLALEALMQLRAVLPEADAKSPLAVGGAIAGDPYLVPTSMVSLTLAAEGWREINLGANTPVSTFCQAIDAHTPELVWISFSVRESAEKFVRDWGEILDLAEARKTTVVVGGKAFPVREAAAHAGRFHHLPNMHELAGFVRALRLNWKNRKSNNAH